LLCTRGKIKLAAPVLAWASQTFDNLLYSISFQAQFAQDTSGYTTFFPD